MNHNQVAKKVRLEKESHPERFCPVKNCLWKNLNGDYCPNHKHLKPPPKPICWNCKAEKNGPESGLCPICGRFGIEVQHILS